MSKPYNLIDSLSSLLIFVVLLCGIGLAFFDQNSSIFLYSPLLFILFGLYLRWKKRTIIPNNSRTYIVLESGPTLKLSNYFLIFPICTLIIVYSLKFFNTNFALSIIVPITILEILFYIFIAIRISITNGETVVQNLN